MNFVSAEFALFLAISYALYWLLPRGRKLLLLAASYLFYAAWDWRFCGLMAFVTLNAHIAGQAIAREQGRRVLWFSIGLDLAVLGWFKYAGFLAGAAVSGLSTLGLDVTLPVPPILLPIGISFYSFHAMSYVIDVYRRKVAARGLADVALYIAFFPQLIAGPIVRAGFFMPQLGRVPPFSRIGQAQGLRLILKGLIYKALIADTLATLADPVFGQLGRYNDAALVTATVAFYGQIYFDFAGYSALAIGTARLFGYRIPKNFDYPYSARS
ncbi:MAG: MBOAT family O-acyltransferase, partial [Aliidongia sp.]